MSVSSVKRVKVYHHRFSKVSKLSAVILNAAFGSAIISSIWAIYLNSLFHSPALVGFFSAGLTLISFFSYFLFIPLMEKVNKSQIYSIALAATGLIYIAFSLTRSFWFFFPISMIGALVGSLRITSFGIILRDNSDPKKVSGNFGLMYSLAAGSWIFAPLLAAYLLPKYGVSLIFSIGALFIFIALLLFRLSRIEDPNSKKKIDKNFIKNFKAFFKSKDRIKCYLMNGGSSLWLILIYLFVPVYIIESGLSISIVGYFLFAVAIIPTFGEYYFGKLAGRIGYKKIFMTGFYLMAATGILAFFISNPYIVLGLLVISSFGIAMTESTTDSYFLDITDNKQELRFFGPYNTAIDSCDFIAKIMAATLLIFLPFNYVFLIFGVLMIFIAWISTTIKDRIESRIK